ncbi:glutathione S-transferase L3-like [Cornus florida]|uniref:glutathione S-transferase L3-like n=1 Tax=Cornus florida TaxID=4283 RepID=UPI002897EA41|nr:glutathione S-transferase L3-like [Cornus florida]
MAALNISYHCTTPASSRLTSSREALSTPFSLYHLSLNNTTTTLPFPNTTLLSPHPPSYHCFHTPLRICFAKARAKASPTIMATGVHEFLPPALDSTSDPPSIFDGTTRLYISYTCPYAQRAWIARNCKGLQDKIKLVPIDLQNRPSWYKEKVYPPNKVPSLEHNNEVKGESLDLIKYIDSNFEGPSLFPDDPAKREFADELFSYTDSFNKAVITSFKTDGISEAGAAFDYIETALSKFDDGPFLLGQFSLVDIAYAPFIERFRPFLLEVKKYDIMECRPKLASWIEEMDKNEAYKQTGRDPKELVEIYKKRFLAQL